jgi:hypothetical protein
MTRIFAAIEAEEDPILNQLEADIDVALEDGSLDTEEYSMERIGDNTLNILDKINNEVTIAEVTPTGVNLSNPKSPEDTEVQEINDTAYVEEAGGQKVPEDYENEVTAEESQVPKAIIPGDEIKEFAKVKDGLIFRIGDSDFRVEFNKNGKGGVVSNIDDERQHWEFDSKTPFDEILKKISEEVEGNKKGVKLLDRQFGEEDKYCVYDHEGGIPYTNLTEDEAKDKVKELTEIWKRANKGRKMVGRRWTVKKMKNIDPRSYSSNNAGFNYSIMQCTVNSDNDRTEWKEVDSNLSYEDAQIKITNLRNQVDTSKYPYTDYKLMNQDIAKNFSGMSEKVQKHFTKKCKQFSSDVLYHIVTNDPKMQGEDHFVSKDEVIPALKKLMKVYKVNDISETDIKVYEIQPKDQLEYKRLWHVPKPEDKKNREYKLNQLSKELDPSKILKDKTFTKKHYEQHKENMMDRNLGKLSPEVRKLVESRIAKRTNPNVKNFNDNEC